MGLAARARSGYGRVMRILVTGASGFVGKHVLAALPDTQSVFTLSRGSVSSRRHLPVDLVDAHSVRAAVAEVAPDCVLHLAAAAQVRPEQEAHANAVNVYGSVHVAEALWAVRPDARFVAVSTGYVLGETVGVADETAPVRPLGPYATTKAQMERVLRACSVGHELCIVRPFNHTGPGQSPSYAVAAFAQKIGAAMERSGAPALWVGDLTAVRDLSDVRDLAHLLAWMCTTVRPPPLVHACSGVGRTMGAVLHDLCSLVGLEPDAVTVHSTGRSALRRNVGRPTPLPAAARPRPTPWLETLRAVLAEQAQGIGAV